MDITSIVSKTNKAGIALIDMLQRDNNEKEYNKIIIILTKYSMYSRELLTRNVFNDYFYDLVYEDYKNKINKNIDTEYVAYVLNILHTKYKDYINEMRAKSSVYTHDDESVCV